MYWSQHTSIHKSLYQSITMTISRLVSIHGSSWFDLKIGPRINWCLYQYRDWLVLRSICRFFSNLTGEKIDRYIDRYKNQLILGYICTLIDVNQTVCKFYLHLYYYQGIILFSFILLHSYYTFTLRPAVNYSGHNEIFFLIKLS